MKVLQVIISFLKLSIPNKTDLLNLQRWVVENKIISLGLFIFFSPWITDEYVSWFDDVYFTIFWHTGLILILIKKNDFLSILVRTFLGYRILDEILNENDINANDCIELILILMTTMYIHRTKNVS